MVSLHLRCPECRRDYVLELPCSQDEAAGFTCTDCPSQTLVLMRYQRSADAAVQESIDDLEKRLVAVEGYLAVSTAAEDEPFDAPEVH